MCVSVFYIIIVGTNGSTSHPADCSVHPLAWPGFTHPHNSLQQVAKGFPMFGTKLYNYHTFSKNSAILIIWHPLPSDGT